MLDDLPDDLQATLEAIRSAPVGWSWTRPPKAQASLDAWRDECRRDKVPPAEAAAWLEGLNGHGAAVAPLEGRGLVERWRLPDGEAVTLTPLAAAALGITLAATGPAELLPRWVLPAEVPAVAYQPRKGGISELRFAETVPDPAPSPLEVLCWEDRNGAKLEPVRLFGLPIPIDPRLAKGPAGKPRKKAPAKARAGRPRKGGAKRPRGR